MLIISNSLTEKVDEGCLKVTYNLIKRLKKSHGGAFVITYERKSELSDRHMELNKLMLNGELRSIIKQKKRKGLVCAVPSEADCNGDKDFCYVLNVPKRLGRNSADENQCRRYIEAFNKTE